MRVKKDAIIHLILQDLKHNQLTIGLRKLGLEADVYNLEIMDVVAELMGITKINDTFLKIYIGFLEQACQTSDLKPLAEKLYKQLCEL
jgi:hypothetical protein